MISTLGGQNVRPSTAREDGHAPGEETHHFLRDRPLMGGRPKLDDEYSSPASPR
jgi:hypothetical protein